MCKGRLRWTVRRFVTLAHFPFARLAMFHDMDEAQWREGLSSHPVLVSLLAGREAGSSMFAPEHDVDAPAVSAKVPVLVLEADASQHSAVYDVMCGEDLVIEGPPGTGKSQTITNIVAAALATGRRVLFVADKQAALQVVKDRLDKVGLGDFCLELHSGKARKTDVLASLAQRLERPVQRPGTNFDKQDDTLQGAGRRPGSALNDRYVAILNAPHGSTRTPPCTTCCGPTGATARTARAVRTRHLDDLKPCPTRSCSTPDGDWRSTDVKSALGRFERAAAPLLELSAGPIADASLVRGVTESRPVLTTEIDDAAAVARRPRTPPRPWRTCAKPVECLRLIRLRRGCRRPSQGNRAGIQITRSRWPV